MDRKRKRGDSENIEEVTKMRRMSEENKVGSKTTRQLLSPKQVEVFKNKANPLVPSSNAKEDQTKASGKIPAGSVKSADRQGKDRKCKTHVHEEYESGDEEEEVSKPAKMARKQTVPAKKSKKVDSDQESEEEELTASDGGDIEEDTGEEPEQEDEDPEDEDYEEGEEAGEEVDENEDVVEEAEDEEVDDEAGEDELAGEDADDDVEGDEGCEEEAEK